jgi:hypothetical protein
MTATMNGTVIPKHNATKISGLKSAMTNPQVIAKNAAV